MKYIFSSQFLKILPPNTSFGDAWESLCLDLLSADDPAGEYMRLGPPDRGVDILHRDKNRAYQCKAHERGAFGTIPAAASLGSLHTAVAHMSELGWNEYYFATTPTTQGNGAGEVLKFGDELGLRTESLRFLGPEHWSQLCEKHLQRVESRLEYRLLVTEAEVIEAFRKARYFDEKVKEYQKLIAGDTYVIELTNNRTPLRLQIPFSPDLTIEHCLNVAMELLGLSLEPEKYHHLGTSAQPRVSLTIGRIPQGFEKKLRDYSEQEIQKLELSITTVCKDLSALEDLNDRTLFLYKRDIPALDTAKPILDPAERRRKTVSRFEESVQQRMWNAAWRESSLDAV